MKKLVIAFTSALLVGSSVLVGMDNEAVIDAARAALEIEGLDGTEQAAPDEMAAPSAQAQQPEHQDEPMPQAQAYTYKLLDGDRLECTDTATGSVLVVTKTRIDGNSSWHLVGQDEGIHAEPLPADLDANLDEQLKRLKREKFLRDICVAAERMTARREANRMAVGGAAVGFVAVVVANPGTAGTVLGFAANPFVAVPVGMAAASWRFRAPLKRGVDKVRGFVANMNPAKRRRMDEQPPK